MTRCQTLLREQERKSGRDKGAPQDGVLPVVACLSGGRGRDYAYSMGVWLGL